MKVIDAFWEIRNIGVRTIEINIDYSDSIENVISILEKVENEYEYIVLRVPVKRIEFNTLMMEKNYKFIETILKIRGNTSIPEHASKMYQKLCQNIEIEESKSIEYIIKEIRKEMFSTDRVSFEFGKHMASKRYEGWLKDIVEKDNTLVFQFAVNGKNTGFIVADVNGVQMNVPLGGVYKPFQGFGYGLHYIAAIKIVAEKLGLKDITATISSNNLEVVKMYSFMGFWIENVFYVFTKKRVWELNTIAKNKQF